MQIPSLCRSVSYLGARRISTPKYLLLLKRMNEIGHRLGKFGRQRSRSREVQNLTLDEMPGVMRSLLSSPALNYLEQ